MNDEDHSHLLIQLALFNLNREKLVYAQADYLKIFCQPEIPVSVMMMLFIIQNRLRDTCDSHEMIIPLEILTNDNSFDVNPRILSASRVVTQFYHTVNARVTFANKPRGNTDLTEITQMEIW